METEMSSWYYSEPTRSSLEYEYGSSSGSNDPSRRATHSDEEEIMLASRHPKKRAGRTKFKETRHPIYRGVRRRNNNKWVCELREPNKKSRIWLGTYSNPEMAARAHDVAALALRGHMACLNFADSVWRLPRPASTSVVDIQKAAAAAAEEFRSPVSSPSPSPSPSPLAQKSSTNSETFDVNDEFHEEHAPRVDYNYMDEEAVFDMPGLLVSMAEGLLLSPPSLVPGCMREECHVFGCDENGNAGTDEMSLWSYSF